MGSVTYHKLHSHTAGWRQLVCSCSNSSNKAGLRNGCPASQIYLSKKFATSLAVLLPLSWGRKNKKDHINWCNSLTDYKLTEQNERSRSQQRDPKRSSGREPFVHPVDENILLCWCMNQLPAWLQKLWNSWKGQVGDAWPATDKSAIAPNYCWFNSLYQTPFKHLAFWVGLQD